MPRLTDTHQSRPEGRRRLSRHVHPPGPTTSGRPAIQSQPAQVSTSRSRSRPAPGQHHVREAARPVHHRLVRQYSSVGGASKLNLLVLDNTESKQQSAKMTNLKLAAHNLLTTLQNRQDAGRRQGRDRALRHKRQRRHRQCQRALDRLDRLGRRQRIAATIATPRKAPANRTARSGRPIPTAPGTAASMTATRITT